MTLYVDRPRWTAHGRNWCHLVSDTSLDELHAFAERHGIPRRAFERDHYDIPGEARSLAITAGAVEVSSREIVTILHRSGLRRRKATAMARRGVGHKLLRPRRLRVGDKVVVVAPSGPAPEQRVDKGVAVLRSWGLEVDVFPHVLAHHPQVSYLAGSDADRAADLMQAWLDDRYAMVIAARGGYGAQRTARLLDWRRLAEAEPKVLCGFSDITTLHQGCASQLGLATVHGHVVTSLGDATPESAEALRRLLFEPGQVRDLTGGRRLRRVTGGQAEGVLVGGNLMLLASSVGTRVSRPAAGSIVVLEEVDERPYSVDRMWTQLEASGWFDDVAGVVIGRFTESGDDDENTRVLHMLAAQLGVPVVDQLDSGHVTTQLPVPFGVSARLDADAGTLTLVDDALA